MDPIAQAVADVIRAMFTKPENVALMVSILANVGMATLIWLMRKEDREDRRAFISTLNGLTATLTDLRIAFAAAGIRSNNHV